MTTAGSDRAEATGSGPEAPPILPFRPNPDDGCWHHATFVLWLLRRERPRTCLGEGRLFAMARTLSAHLGDAPRFVVGQADEESGFDLLLRDADGIASRDPEPLDRRHADAFALIGNVAPAAAPTLAERHRGIVVDGPQSLVVVPPPSAGSGGAWTADHLRSVAEHCATVNAEWLLRQRVAELAADNDRLRRQLSRLAAEGSRAEAVALTPVRTVDPVQPAQVARAEHDLAMQLAEALRRGGRLVPSPLRPPLRSAVRGGLRFGRWGHGLARRQVWRRRARAALRQGDFFDPDWYRARYPDVAASGQDPMRYFLRVGMWRRDEVSPRFSGAWYLSTYPDVATSPHHPLLHYLWVGQQEGREIRGHADDSAHASLRHEIAASGLFDPAWYAARNPELAASGEDPLEHFLTKGIAATAEASPQFHGARYLRENADVRNAGVHPLLHYIRHGRSEGRQAHPNPSAPPPPRADQLEARAFSLQLSPVTLFRVTIGIVTPHERDADLLRQAVAAATSGLDGIGRKDSDRIMVLDRSGHLPPGVLAEWPADVIPSSRGLSLAAAHNQLAKIAFAQGSDIHVALSARGVLREDALAAMIRMVRAAGRQAIVGATATGDGEPADIDPPWLASPAIAIPRAVWDATGGFDTDFTCEGADIDFGWRARDVGFAPMRCPDALFERVEQTEPRDATRLTGAWILARKWGLATLEQDAAGRLDALGFSTTALNVVRLQHSAPPAAPPLEAVVAPW